MKRTVKPSIVTMMILVIALVLSGCYWTPEGEEGAITLEIGAGEIGSSQLEDYNGFFFGYVIADDLLRGDSAAAERAFEEVNAALDELFLNEPPQSPEDFQINVAFPSIQVQANLFRGDSGSNTFAGLRAGAEYLVVIIAGTSTGEGIGFTTATVEAGKSKTVRLGLGNNYAEFERFLVNRYGVQYGESSTGTIAIQSTGTFGDSLYVDILDGATPDPPSNPDVAMFTTWYSAALVLNAQGNLVDRTQPRPLIQPGSSVFGINTLPANRSYRILIAQWADREDAGGGGSIYVSPPVTVGSGTTTTLTFQSGDGDDFQFDSVGN